MIVLSSGNGAVGMEPAMEVLRTCTTRGIVLYMKMGLDLETATGEALADLRDLRDPYVEHIALIALDRYGRHIGLGHRADERYVFMADDMPAPDEAPVEVAQ